MSLLSRHFAPLACAAFMAATPVAFATPTFQGLWCGNGLLQEFTLKLAAGRSRGEVDGTLSRRGRAREVHGSFEGSTLRTEVTRQGSLVLTLIGSELRVVDGAGPLALAAGASFRRARGDSCGN